MKKILLAIFTTACLLPSCCSPKVDKQNHHYQENGYIGDDGGQYSSTERSYTDNDGRHHYSYESNYYNEHNKSGESPNGESSHYYKETIKTKRYHSTKNTN